MKLERGTYTGNGVDNRVIALADASLDIQWLIVTKRAATGQAVFLVDTGMLAQRFTCTFAAFVYNPGTVLGNTFGAAGSASFTVFNHTNTNELSATYDYLAVCADGSNDVAVGIYTGNGTSQTIVISPAFQPDLVIVKGLNSGASTGTAIFKTAEMSALNSISFNTAVAAAGTANAITGFVANGFTVGANGMVNTNTGAYVYIALKKVTGKLRTMSYVGNDLDDRLIDTSTAPAIVPIAAWTKKLDTGVARNAIHRMQDAANVGSVDESMYLHNSGLFTNKMQRLFSNGFQVGTDPEVNENPRTFYAVVWGLATTTLAKSVSGSVALAADGVMTPNKQRAAVAGTVALSVAGVPAKVIANIIQKAVASNPVLTLTLSRSALKTRAPVVGSVTLSVDGVPSKVIAPPVNQQKSVAGTVALSVAGAVTAVLTKAPVAGTVALSVAGVPVAVSNLKQKAVAGSVALSLAGVVTPNKQRAAVAGTVALSVGGTISKAVVTGTTDRWVRVLTDLDLP